MISKCLNACHRDLKKITGSLIVTLLLFFAFTFPVYGQGAGQDCNISYTFVQHDQANGVLEFNLLVNNFSPNLVRSFSVKPPGSDQYIDFDIDAAKTFFERSFKVSEFVQNGEKWLVLDPNGSVACDSVYTIPAEVVLQTCVPNEAATCSSAPPLTRFACATATNTYCCNTATSCNQKMAAEGAPPSCVIKELISTPITCRPGIYCVDQDSCDQYLVDHNITGYTGPDSGVTRGLLLNVDPLNTFGSADSPDSIGSALTRFLNYFAFPIAGLILFVMLIWGGFEILAQSATKKSIDAGKQRITNALVGFFLLFASYWIAQLIEVIFGVTIL